MQVATAASGGSMQRFGVSRQQTRMNFELKRTVGGETVIEPFTAFGLSEAITEAFARLEVRGRSYEVFRAAGGIAIFQVSQDGSTRTQVFPRMH